MVSGWREGDGWRVATDALRLRGKDYGAAVRGGLWWQGDGSRPRIDLAAQIDDTQVTVARQFWVRHLMPKATIAWLDNALVAGVLRNGRAVVSGDLDDWPFRDHDGLFRADAHIANATLKFQPDWPAAEQVEGDVSFIADGFTVDGKGAIAGVGIRQFHAGIPRFGTAELTVQAQGGADASKLIGLLKQSPVQKEHAETLANVSASGPAAVTFDMLLPMHREPGASERRFGGTVELRGRPCANNAGSWHSTRSTGAPSTAAADSVPSSLPCATTDNPASSRCAPVATRATSRRRSRPTSKP